MSSSSSNPPAAATDLARWQAAGDVCFPGHLNIRVEHLERGLCRLSMPVTPTLFAPNGFLHAGSLVTLADTACGYGCMATLPEGASGFTTIELKTNHLGTAREGVVLAEGRAVHIGRTTQVWESTLTHNGKVIVLFRCTQMILYPRA
jgi:1,4-dihydroxy-2-naphthoyl-CoA hydrolase